MHGSRLSKMFASLLLRFIILLLVIVVPVGVLLGTANFQQAEQDERTQVQREQQIWVGARSNELSTILVEEAERLTLLAEDDTLRNALSRTPPNELTTAQLSRQWQREPPSGSFRSSYTNNNVALALSYYNNKIPRRAFTLLAWESGPLIAVTDGRWPEFDLRAFEWYFSPEFKNRPLTILLPQTISPAFKSNLVLIVLEISGMVEVGTAARPNTGLLIVGFDLATLALPTMATAQGLPQNEVGLVVNSSGNIIFSSDKLVFGNISESWLPYLAASGIFSGEHPRDYNGLGGPVVFSYAPVFRDPIMAQNDQLAIAAVNRLHWGVTRAAPVKLVYASLQERLDRLTFTALLIISIILLLLIASFRLFFLRPINRLNRAMEQVAEGNFSTRVPASSSEIGVLGGGFNQMVADVDELMRERERRQQQQAGISRQLQGSAVDLSGSAEQQSAFAAEQAASLREIAATFGQLSQSAERIARYGAQVTAVAATLQGEQEQGQAAVARSQAVLKRLRSESETLTIIAQRQARSSGAISTIIAEINRIAEETHLLALNATIEASGAGVAGKRFAAIARQVQGLAGQAAVAAENAKQSLSEVQGSIQRAVEATERERVAISDGTQQGDTLEAIMQVLSSTIEQLNGTAHTIAQETGQQRDGSRIAVRTVDQLAGAGQQLVGYSRAVSNAAEQLQALANQLVSPPPPTGALPIVRPVEPRPPRAPLKRLARRGSASTSDEQAEASRTQAKHSAR